MSVVDYLVLFGFLTGILWLGTHFYRWVGNPDDFFVAGRQLSPFILAATLTATNISLFSFVGVSGSAYAHGLSIIWLTWTGNMALVFSGLFVIPVFRRLQIRTIPEFLEMRYNGAVRLLVGVLWVLRLAFWLGVVLYAGVTAAEQLTGIHSFTFWILVLSLVVVIYTALGGMWSIVLTNTLQFLLMMLGVLIVLPLAMRAAGWWPAMVARLPAGHVDLITASGPYNWKFVLALWLLGIEWACLDQGLLQAAFSSRSTRVVATGMVLSGILTTPFSFLWVSPGLAARVLHPGLAKPEMAVPSLIAELLPTGVLGFVVCGMLASQISTIESNLGAAATLFTNDLYSRFLRRRASRQEILLAARVATAGAGLIMIGITYLVPYLGGSVDAYLTLISITDMPLCVIAVGYGLLWRRATWQGAVAGYLCGAGVGALLRFGLRYEVAAVTFASGGVAALVCFVVSLSTPAPPDSKIRRVFGAKRAGTEEMSSGEVHHILPRSVGGKLGLAVLALGFAVFLTSVVLGSQASQEASRVAVAGMIIYFVGGLLRTRFE